MTKYPLSVLKDMEFGYLKVIDEEEPKEYIYNGHTKKMRMMLCMCKCGNKKIISLNNLLHSTTISCGCYKKQFLKHYKEVM